MDVTQDSQWSHFPYVTHLLKKTYLPTVNLNMDRHLLKCYGMSIVSIWSAQTMNVVSASAVQVYSSLNLTEIKKFMT